MASLAWAARHGPVSPRGVYRVSGWVDLLERRENVALLAGEAQLEERAGGAVRQGEVAALAGWCPAAEVPRVAERLAAAGGALLPLPYPHGTDPPTLLRPRAASFTPLVTTYGTPAYADVDPSWPAGLAYVAMFGIMFGDVGHGALLVLGAVALRLGWPRRSLPSSRRKAMARSWSPAAIRAKTSRAPRLGT